ncbi:hypothetical protein ES708_01779 [subsurface metagenome]
MFNMLLFMTIFASAVTTWIRIMMMKMATRMTTDLMMKTKMNMVMMTHIPYENAIDI